MKFLLRLAYLLTALAAASLAPAQSVVLHFTGEAQNQILGYFYGQSYTFDVVISDNFISTHNSFTSSPTFSQNDWRERDGDTPLFYSISGTGFSGDSSFEQPGDHPGSNLTFITNNTTVSNFSLAAGTLGEATGLKSPSLINVNFLANFSRSPIAFDDLPSNLQPAAYFNNYGGSYSVSGASGYWGITDGTETIYFTPTAFSITAPATPVPESSTYAALAGLGALGLALYRRCQRR